MDTSKVKGIIGIVIIAGIVFFSPFDRESGEFSKILRSFGHNQYTYSEKLTNEAVSDIEGKYVGEHKVNGSNWAIPNIIRHLLGVDS